MNPTYQDDDLHFLTGRTLNEIIRRLSAVERSIGPGNGRVRPMGLGSVISGKPVQRGGGFITFPEPMERGQVGVIEKSSLESRFPPHVFQILKPLDPMAEEYERLPMAVCLDPIAEEGALTGRFQVDGLALVRATKHEDQHKFLRPKANKECESCWVGPYEIIEWHDDGATDDEWAWINLSQRHDPFIGLARGINPFAELAVDRGDACSIGKMLTTVDKDKDYPAKIDLLPLASWGFEPLAIAAEDIPVGKHGWWHVRGLALTNVKVDAPLTSHLTGLQFAWPIAGADNDPGPESKGHLSAKFWGPYRILVGAPFTAPPGQPGPGPYPVWIDLTPQAIEILDGTTVADFTGTSSGEVTAMTGGINREPIPNAALNWLTGDGVPAGTRVRLRYDRYFRSWQIFQAACPE